MNNKVIKVGFCIAYDWKLLYYSLPLIYDQADVICLSLDSHRISWGGEKFQFDEKEFKTFVTGIDLNQKIRVLEDSFYLPELSPMQNEVRQRNKMAEFMGDEGWHIQLDCDEYFVEFKSFVAFLKGNQTQSGSTNICCIWITLFKKLSNGFLLINPQRKASLETVTVASRKPQYRYGRKNGNFNFYTNYRILHQSWARSEEDIKQKISSWGHKNDFNGDQFIDFWKSVDEANYKTAKNFHPIDPPQWQVVNRRH